MWDYILTSGLLKKVDIQPMFPACIDIMYIQIEGITLSEGITQVQ